MSCYVVGTKRGGVAILCTRTTRPPVRRCLVCNQPETLCTIRLCDGPHPTRRNPALTCDAVICTDHAVHVEPDTDYCPRCAKLKELDT
jgi:hypothetical protein